MKKCVLYDAWAMGDSLIAASMLLLLSDSNRYVLACQKSWQPLISLALNRKDLQFLTVALAYTEKNKGRDLRICERPPVTESSTITDVINIRGDLRDLWSARRIFPRAKMHMTGFAGFIIRRSALLNYLFKTFGFTVKNRYELWCKILNLPYSELKNIYLERMRSSHNLVDSQKIALHLGAQWRSRQFPDVLKLQKLLIEHHFIVSVIAGPNDKLPEGLEESDVSRLVGEDLVKELQSVALLICNDSGVMHLGALMGKPTLAIALISNIQEWLPPGVHAVCAEEMPKGYRPRDEYTSDNVIEGWPTADVVMTAVLAYRAQTGCK